MSALSKLQKHFPQVKKVVDAEKSLIVSVTRDDVRFARKKDTENCALARACVRQKIASSAVIGIGTSYLINGTVATRYHTSTTVAREITSFDRHADFAEGTTYRLSKISPASRLGTKPGPKQTGPHNSKFDDKWVKHHTANIRVIKRVKR